MTRNLWWMMVLTFFGLGVAPLVINAYYIHSDVTSLSDPMVYETYTSLSWVAAIGLCLVLLFGISAYLAPLCLAVTAVCFVFTVVLPNHLVVEGWLFSWLGLSVSLAAALAAKLKHDYVIYQQRATTAPPRGRIIIRESDLL